MLSYSLIARLRFYEIDLSRRRILVIVASGIFCLILNLLVGFYRPIPVPAVHDEFAYLLAGDTYSKGRLTNPTHPMWHHFETFHVFHVPTYQAKYPPGQGAFLALGQVLADMPILGVWISLALACGATCWMLQALFPPAWAFLGALLLASNPCLLCDWGQGYWGGAVALLGGSLFFGAIFRLRQKLQLRNTLILGLGAIILANSRPFEGLIVCIASSPFILFATKEGIRKNLATKLLSTCFLPLTGICFLLVAWILYYNHCLSGDMFKLYYLNWDHSASNIELIRSYTGSFPLPAKLKLLRFWQFFLGPFLGLALCFALLEIRSALKRKEILFAFVVSIIMMVVSTIFSRAHAHYVAPITCLIYAVIVQGLNRLRDLRIKGRRFGLFLVYAIAVLHFVHAANYLIASCNTASTASSKEHYVPYESWRYARQAIYESLLRKDGKDLIMVRYLPNHNPHREWVYNRADIDKAEVVWARELSPQQNKILIDYFKDRKVWIVFADETPPLLFHYNSGELEEFNYQ